MGRQGCAAIGARALARVELSQAGRREQLSVGDPGHWIELGRLGRPHGLRGWLRVQSWCEPPQHLFEHPTWRLLRADGSVEQRRWAERQGDPPDMRVRLEDVRDATAAALWVGATISVAREQLGALAPGEHYRADLLGFEVRNLEQHLLGVLDHFVDAPANPVMVLRGPPGSARAKERWVPLTRQHLHRIDAAARTLWVDWPADF